MNERTSRTGTILESGPKLRFRPTAILMLALASSGCSQTTLAPGTTGASGRIFERPVSASPHSSHDEGSDNLGKATSPSVELPERLTLEEARKIALEHSPDIRAAIARLEGASARIGEARAAWFPTVAMVHSSSRQFLIPASSNRFINPFIPQSPALDAASNGTDLATEIILNTLRSLPIFGNNPVATGSSQSFSQHASNFAVTWTVFDGFVRDARLSSAEHSQRSADHAVRDVRRLLLQAVDTAFHQAQLGLEQVRVSEADRAFNQDQLEIARRRLEAGKVREDEVESLDVLVRTAEDDVTVSKGLHEVSLTILAELMALPGAKFPDEVQLAGLDDETAEELAAQDAETWIALATAQRADVAALAEQVRAAESNVKVARGQFYPTVNLTGTWGFDRISNVRYEDDDQNSALALEVNYPIYTGGLRTSQVQRAAAELSEARAELDGRKLSVASEVRSSVIDLRNAQDRLASQKLTLATADSARRKVARQYEAGKVTLAELRDAQRDYLVADASLAQARINLRQAWSNLRTAAQAQ